MSDVKATPKIGVNVVYSAGATEHIKGADMDFSIDDRGFLVVYDYSLREAEKPVSGTVFIAAPGFWASAAFAA